MCHMMQVIVDDKYLLSKFTDTIVLDLLSNQSNVTTRYDGSLHATTSNPYMYWHIYT